MRAILFIACLFGGIVLGETSVFTPLHEQGHIAAANAEGKKAELIARNKTRIYGEVTFHIWVAGYRQELWTATATTALFFTIGVFLRKVWPIVGIPWGYVHQLWWRPIGSTDFERAGEEVWVWWHSAVGLTLTVGWLVILGYLWITTDPFDS